MPEEGCLGRLSALGTKRVGIGEEETGRYFIALERTASEEVERIVAIDPLAPPTLIVEAVNPDEREGWILRTVTESFALGSVTSIRSRTSRAGLACCRLPPRRGGGWTNTS